MSPFAKSCRRVLVCILEFSTILLLKLSDVFYSNAEYCHIYHMQILVKLTSDLLKNFSFLLLSLSITYVQAARLGLRFCVKTVFFLISAVRWRYKMGLQYWLGTDYKKIRDSFTFSDICCIALAEIVVKINLCKCLNLLLCRHCGMGLNLW
jgi:hypothetical protein